METLFLLSSSPLFVSLILLFIDMVCVFLVALYLKDNSIIDVAYGLAYILVSATVLYGFGEYPLGGLLLLLVSIWGLRLAIRIHERNRGRGEDFRYAAWRKSWVWFKTRSFLQIFMLQGFIVWLISIPVVLAASTPAPFPSWLTVVGVLVWLIGFYFEAVGDYQLDAFIKNPANKGKLMQSGLWSITRHPNYFGEASMWWGLWIAALPAVFPHGVLAALLTFIMSPALITLFLLKISGIPMLEAAMQQKPGWNDYARRVSVFIPWFPKR